MITFNTEGKRESAKETLRLGAKTDFWKLILEVLDDNIESLRKEQDSDEFRELDSHQYKTENEILKAKINYLKQLKKTPDNVIGWLGNPDSGDFNPDPYDK